MSTLPTTSTLGLDLGPVSASATLPSALSANGTFAVESYTPSDGRAGSLLTVNLIYFNTTLPTNQVDDFRLIINDKKLYSRVKHDSNGKVTLRALLSTSFASLYGSVPMSLYLHRDGTLFDYCNFGHFNFVPMPMATTSLSASAHAPSKRNRDDDESRSPSPERKKSKLLAAGPVSTGDSQRVKLIIESDIAKIGDLSTWSQAEMRDRRRFVRLMRKQQGSSIRLRMIAVSTEEVERDDRNVINCMLPPDCGDEPSVSSVDIIKALEVLVNPPDHRLSIEEKNRVRRNIDTLRPTTLKKGDGGLNWIMRLRSPRPITIAKDVKVFKWTSLEAALVKVMNKYSYQNDGSLVEQRGSPTFGETGHQLDEASAKPEPQTPSPAPCGSASPETNTIAATVLEPSSPACKSPVSSALASILSSTNERFCVQQSHGVDALLSLDPDLLLQNLLEPPASLCSASTASVSSASTLSSDSGLGLELMTPVDMVLAEYFDVENGCDVSSNGSEYLSHVDLEALFAMPMDAGLEDLSAVGTPNLELLSAAGFEAYPGEIFKSYGIGASYDINQWDFACEASKPSDLDVSTAINSHLFSTYP